MPNDTRQMSASIYDETIHLTFMPTGNPLRTIGFRFFPIIIGAFPISFRLLRADFRRFYVSFSFSKALKTQNLACSACFFSIVFDGP
jgi:hypothetical protein